MKQCNGEYDNETRIENALIALGRGLHAKQDSLTHTGPAGNIPMPKGVSRSVVFGDLTLSDAASKRNVYFHLPWGLGGIDAYDAEVDGIAVKALTEAALDIFINAGRANALF